jgi:8-hydroxy-5-deazaflavin:NADPH oxidoreductase
MGRELEAIAVIGGTGAEGSALARRFGNAGHPVLIGSRDRVRAAKTADELNQALGTSLVSGADSKTAAAEAQIVVLTVPYAAQLELLADLREALSGKILIDATVPLIPPAVSRVQLPEGGSAAAAAQALLGGSVRLVSAFQNVAAHKLDELGTDADCDVLVCADDAGARALVIGLAQRIGLRAIDAGPLCNSAAAEALTSILIHINRKYKIPGAGIRITGIDAGVRQA